MAGVQHKQPASGNGALSFSASIIDPRAWAHLLRMVHYYNYSHVRPRRLADIGPGVRMAPNVSMRNAERIKIGAYSHVGARCSLWAGNSVGRITLGHHALLGPEVFITAANYRVEPGTPIMDQPMDESDVVIGDDVWLGARVMVVAGVEIGDGCIIGASSVVTRSIPAGSIAAGNPARILGRRGDPKAESAVQETVLKYLGAGVASPERRSGP
jgi:acetyltransferase-like isoleucine patch superfamily enzyme